MNCSGQRGKAMGKLKDIFQQYENLRDRDPVDVLCEYFHCEPTAREGSTYRFPCPYCNSKDNMSYNSNKDILHCFGSGGDKHASQLISEITKAYITQEEKKNYKNKNFSKPTYKSYKKEIFMPENSPYKREFADISHSAKFQEMLQDYCNRWACCLTADLGAKELNFLTEKRGFTKDTIKDLKIGFCENDKLFNFNTGETEKRNGYAFPKFVYSTNPNDNTVLTFEFRSPDFKAKWVWAGLPNTSLCQINKYTPDKTDTLLVTEGFMDGYAWYQQLKSIGKEKHFHIVTPSNGIGRLEEQLKQVDWTKYKKFILSIDNDDDGNKNFYKIMRTYTDTSGKPLFIDARVDCAKCARPCGIYSKEMQELIERDSDPENCPPLAEYFSLIKAGLPCNFPCKDCDIANCNYKIWVESRCKDYNDYLRKALL